MLLFAIALFAQVTLVPVVKSEPEDAFNFQPYVQVYTTADPVTPDLIGLATPNGRYSIQLVRFCDEIAPGQNIGIYSPAFGSSYLPGGTGYWVGPIDTAPQSNPQQLCLVDVKVLHSTVPCFTNGAGECDVAMESE